MVISPSFFTAAADVGTLGASRKIEAATAAFYLKHIKGDKRSFKDLYSIGLDIAQALEAERFRQNPIQSFAGSLAGGSILPAAKGAGYLGSALTGAGYGALTGALSNTSGEKGKFSGQDLVGGVKGALMGAPLGAAGQGITNAVTKYAPPALNAIGGKLGALGEKIGKAKEYIIPPHKEVPGSISMFEKYKIPYKKSDITGEPLDLLAEENALIGDFGAKTQEGAKQFQEQQRKAFSQGQEKLHAETLGKGIPFTEKGADVKEVIAELQKKAIAERAPINEAYEVAKKEIGKLDISEVNRFPDFAEHILTSPENSFSKSNAPTAYSQLRAFKELFSNPAKKNPDIKDVDFRGLETWRQGLNKSLGKVASDQDEAGLNALKDSFDQWIGDNIESALTEGNSKVLQKFKDARLLNSEWMKKYYGNNKEDIGKNFVRKMVDSARNNHEPLTPEILVNKIFGVGGIGFSNESALIVKELKKHVPARAMDQLRSEAGARLLEPLTKHTPNVTTFNNNLTKFLKENHSLAKELFEPKQIEELKNFGEIARKIYGDKTTSKLNKSQSGFRNKLEEVANKKVGWIAKIFAKPPVEFNQAALKKELLKGQEYQIPIAKSLRGVIPLATEE